MLPSTFVQCIYNYIIPGTLLWNSEVFLPTATPALTWPSVDAK